MGNNKVYLKRITIVAIIVFGVFISFKTFYSAFANDYDDATSLLKGSFSYDLDEPDDKIELDDEYEEISGMDYEDRKIYFVIDEKQEVYAYNLITNRVEVIWKSNELGDYEGIALTDSFICLILSNGGLSLTSRAEALGIIVLDNPFSDKNNIEGLCYDKEKNRLLIACKGKPLKDLEQNHKGIYSFDLDKNELVDKAVYDISDKDVFGDKQKKKDNFGPSGIAVHPITGEIYIIAHVGKVIFALNREGKVVRSKRLNPEIFKQPEGICFNEKGDMYISNEGNGGKANILKFNYTAK